MGLARLAVWLGRARIDLMASRPRILALLSDGYGARGGIARYNQDLLDVLGASGADILVLPRHGDASGLVLPKNVIQMPAVYGRAQYLMACILALLRHRPFDVVFCGHIYMASMAWAFAKLLKARLWMQAHGTEVAAAAANGGSTRRTIEAADLVTVVSRATRHELLGWADLAPERARVLPDTVRDSFVPGPASEELRTRLRLGPGPILLTVGRLASTERYKGHESIFATLPALRAKFPTLVHVVAGEGDDRIRLEARAAELARDPAAVRFVGFVPEENLPDLYRLADLYVMPSTHEGFGIVYLEAAACGLRVIGGKGGGSADAVATERIGVLVEPSDTAALTATIERLLGEGRVDPAAIAPYRKGEFAHSAQRLLARLMDRPRRKRGEP
jgi:phosphatidylinositol alpha-1,6-mannosyltransferase